MDIREAIRERHSVRQFAPDQILGDVRTTLETLIQQCNDESGLHIQLITDDPECFDTFMAHYGKFSGANNYIAMVGRKNLKKSRRTLRLLRSEDRPRSSDAWS